jgi:hypothetical protein
MTLSTSTTSKAAQGISDKRVLLLLLLNSHSSHQPLSCSSCLPCTVTSNARTPSPLALRALSVTVSLIWHTAGNGTSCHSLQCSSACRLRAREYTTSACATSHAAPHGLPLCVYIIRSAIMMTGCVCRSSVRVFTPPCGRGAQPRGRFARAPPIACGAAAES